MYYKRKRRWQEGQGGEYRREAINKGMTIIQGNMVLYIFLNVRFSLVMNGSQLLARCFLNSQEWLHQSSEIKISYLLFQTHTSIHLSVRNDSTPETYEVFVVHLNNLQTFGIASAGHASFIQGKTTATISISASDRPHGVIELEAGSRMVTRNDEKKPKI